MIVTRRSLIADNPPSPEKWAEARAAAKRALAEMTPEEDAAITADAMSDPDSLPMTDDEFANARLVPLSEVLSNETFLRLDTDIADRLDDGSGDWEARANELLRRALA